MGRSAFEEAIIELEQIWEEIWSETWGWNVNELDFDHFTQFGNVDYFRDGIVSRITQICE